MHFSKVILSFAEEGTEKHCLLRAIVRAPLFVAERASWYSQDVILRSFLGTTHLMIPCLKPFFNVSPAVARCAGREADAECHSGLLHGLWVSRAVGPAARRLPTVSACIRESLLMPAQTSPCADRSET